MEGDDVSHIINSEGRKLFRKNWYPKLSGDQRPRACVFVSHGYAEHCQKYNKLAEALTEKGMFVFSHDHVGHGLSEGDRVHVEHSRTFIDDVVQHVNLIKAKYTDVPLFIIGHSVGGLITLKTALDNPNLFTGVALIGPALVIDPALASSFMVWLARRLAYWFPQFQLKSLNPDHICRDQNVVKEIVDDPLTWHGGVKARLAVCLLDLINDVTARFSDVTLPLYIIHGTDDFLCSSEGSQLLYDKARSANKVLKMYPGAYHQVHKEPDGVGEECVSDLAKWILSVADK